MWDYGRGFDIGRYIETFASNIITRVIGFVMRLFLITLFLIYEVIVLIIGTILFFTSIIYPFLFIIAIIYGFKYL
ncbi:MAG TPA: hypothetical protein PLD14_02675 [Candidatus Pacearchaeota archaeon]|nr:hypothetical protein [Candidatus Pacearchaeota archaeon]HPR80105.1 hypothetical protein [Candidatus Pacearchaeota archaeon]